MRNELEGKRLLLLGGSYCKNAIKQYAAENNIFLIAAGNNPNAGIVDIADTYYNVNSTDPDTMRKLIKEASIDGVYLGSSEPVIAAALTYLPQMGYPCYCTKAQWELFQNKRKFKALCKEYGLPVVPCYEPEGDTLPEEMFPVITKPADGCGSNGFSVCSNNDELKRGIHIAREGSASGSVLVEKFVKNDGVVVFYTFSDGKTYFSGIEDKFPIRFEKQGSYVAGMHMFQSSLLDEFKEKFHKKICDMFSSLDIREGTIWMEVFHDGDDYYFNEAGYRYSGSVSPYPVDYFYDINQVATDMYYALTGRSKIFGHSSIIEEGKNRKRNYCVYPLMLGPGTIDSIEGVDTLSANRDFILIPQIKKVGDTIEPTGTVGQTFSYLHFVFDTVQELKSTIDLIHSTVRVLDENGENMVERRLEFASIDSRL